MRRTTVCRRAMFCLCCGILGNWLLLPGSSGAAQLVFSPPEVFYFDGQATVKMTHGEFNGDGIPDLVTSNFSNRGIWFHAGVGDGRFTESRRIDTLGASGTSDGLATGDFDEDGHLDFVVSLVSLSAIGLYRGDGRGGFEFAGTTPARSRVRGLAVADFNFDSHLDVAAANGYLDLFLGDGRGGFSRSPGAEYPFVANVINLKAVDVNGDSIIDLVSANNGAVSVGIFIGDGIGGFESRQLLQVGVGLDQVVIGDLDGDSFVDLAVNQISGSVWIYPGDGSGFFPEQPNQIVTTPGCCDDLLVADLDENGVLDLFVADRRRRTVVTLRRDSSGAFLVDQEFAMDVRASRLSVFDVNGDSSQDLVGISLDSEVSVRLNETPGLGRCPESRRGRVNGGAGDPVDVLFLNGSAGGPDDRVVEYRVLDEFVLEMKAPPGIPAGETAPFVVYVWGGRHESTRLGLLYGMGCVELPIPMTGGEPQPDLIWNNAGRYRVLGRPNRGSLPAPSVFLRRSILRRVGVFFIQGLIFDPGSSAAVPASLTNGILARPVF